MLLYQNDPKYSERQVFGSLQTVQNQIRLLLNSGTDKKGIWW